MRPSLLFSSLLLVACGGKSIDTGYDDTRVDAFNPAAPVDMVAIGYRCAAVGTVEPYVTDAAQRAFLAGRWFLCETADGAGMEVPPAIEFTADGNWFALSADSA